MQLFQMSGPWKPLRPRDLRVLTQRRGDRDAISPLMPTQGTLNHGTRTSAKGQPGGWGSGSAGKASAL